MNANNTRLLLSVSLFVAWAAGSVTGCTEQIDETGTPLSVGSQLRTTVEAACDEDGAEEGCTKLVTIESARSKDDQIIDVTEFGEGYVEVEGVGSGETDVIAKGQGKRFRIRYAVSEEDAGELEVRTIAVERLTSEH